MATRRVLVIEDDRDLRENIGELLGDEGYEVALAENGKEGLRQARQRRPGIIVLDLMMPVMNGWEFCEAQRMDPVLAEIPVIVISAAAQCPPAAADAFLPKPFDGERLIELVDRHVPHAA